VGIAGDGAEVVFLWPVLRYVIGPYLHPAVRLDACFKGVLPITAEGKDILRDGLDSTGAGRCGNRW